MNPTREVRSDSDDDFETTPFQTPQSRRLNLSLRRRNRRQPAASDELGSRLRAAINMARASIQANGQSPVATELGRRFNNGGSNSGLPARGTRRRQLRGQTWKVVPCCVTGPTSVRIPTKGPLNELCKRGLGTLWFSASDKLQIDTSLSPEEFHFLLLCLYPMLNDIPYELCKAAGPGHNVIVPLTFEEDTFRPDASRPFSPHFSPDEVKSQVGRKGRLYIRPVIELNMRLLPRFLEHEVSS